MLPIELPTFEATWRPVMLETVPGSEERITIAVIVRAASGQAQARQAIPPTSLSTMFGQSAGKGMLLLVVQTVVSLQHQLDKGVRVEDLEPPFGGIEIGAARDCVARDINEVFDVAIRLCGAFGLSQFGTSERSQSDSERAFDEWAEKVRLQLVSNESTLEWSSLFNVVLPLANRRRTRIGFVRGSYVANFGVLRPGRSTSSDVRVLKVKLFDLEVLRRSQAIVVGKAELIVGCLDWSAESVHTRRELDAIRDSWQFIEHEAKQRSVVPIRCNRPTDAALHLMREAA